MLSGLGEVGGADHAAYGGFAGDEYRHRGLISADYRGCEAYVASGEFG